MQIYIHSKQQILVLFPSPLCPPCSLSNRLPYIQVLGKKALQSFCTQQAHWVRHHQKDGTQKRWLVGMGYSAISSEAIPTIKEIIYFGLWRILLLFTSSNYIPQTHLLRFPQWGTCCIISQSDVHAIYLQHKINSILPESRNNRLEHELWLMFRHKRKILRNTFKLWSAESSVPMFSNYQFACKVVQNTLKIPFRNEPKWTSKTIFPLQLSGFLKVIVIFFW